MRARTCVPLLVCLLGNCWVAARAQDSPDIATLRTLETKWADSYKNRQVDVLSSLMADDYVITMEDGSVYGKVGFISHTAQPSEKVSLVEFGDLKIRMHGDAAVVTGSYHEQGESAGKPYDYHDRMTDLWMKMDGKWKLVASHYSLPAH
ncbi:MAG TPA: nuclear transport factor 2 family protein [Candidatus Sulfotelmatobacter sp.]